MNRRLVVSLLLAIGALRATAQGVAGTVLDSATRQPVARAAVSLLTGRSSLATTRTDDSGRFQLKATSPGTYTVRIQLVGYRPFTRDMALATSTVTRETFVIARTPVTLDSVVTSGRVSFFNVTPGRTKYTEHLKLNAGQFVSGLEIQRAKMDLVEFLGTLPGLRFVPTIPPQMRNSMMITSPPAIPGRTGYLIGEGGKCLYGRVDHWSIAFLLYTQSTDDLGSLVPVADVMGVEVYLPDEVPREWKADATPDEVLLRYGPGRNYLVGNGSPRINQYMLQEMPTGESPEVVAMKRKFPDTVRTEILSPSPPKCGFVQIWTRVSW